MNKEDFKSLLSEGIEEGIAKALEQKGFDSSIGIDPEIHAKHHEILDRHLKIVSKFDNAFWQVLTYAISILFLGFIIYQIPSLAKFVKSAFGLDGN